MEEKNKENKKRKEVKISTIIYSALIIIFGAVITIGVLIYGFGWNNNLTKKAEGLIPYPAVIINTSNLISIKNLSDNLNSVKKFYESQDFSKINMRIDFSTENGKRRLKLKEKNVLNRMIEDKSIEIIAKSKGIRVTDTMIDQNLNRKMEEYGSGDNLIKNLDRIYGWTVDDFKNKVLKSDLYQQELEKKFAEENKSIPEAKSQIEKAKDELEKNKDFSETAKKYSKGLTAEDGGELGWFKKDQLIPEISNKVFSFDKGKISDVMESPLGFHIVEVEDKKTENGDELVKIRQIFSPKQTFAEFLTEEMKKMKFIILLKDYSWNQEKAVLEFRSEEMKNFEKNIIENSQGDASVLF